MLEKKQRKTCVLAGKENQVKIDSLDHYKEFLSHCHPVRWIGVVSELSSRKVSLTQFILYAKDEQRERKTEEIILGIINIVFLAFEPFPLSNFSIVVVVELSKLCERKRKLREKEQR